MTHPSLEELVPAGSLHRLETVGSTNDEARRLAASGAPGGTVVVAWGQTSGRGRHGRAWHSPPGRGLYVSVLFRPAGGPEEGARYTLVGAVAACRAARAAGAEAVEIEWPNDLVWRGRKVGGILAELRSTGAEVHDLVLGAGFNVDQGEGEFPEALADTATSLRLAAGRTVDREQLLALYLRELFEAASRLRAGGFEELRQTWSRLAPASSGRRVRVAGGHGGGPFEAVTEGIDSTGALRVRSLEGCLRTLTLAESVLAWEA